MPLDIRNIPKIMKHEGWGNAARLLDRWFDLPATTAPHYGPPDTTTIRMDAFALTYARVRAFYENDVLGARIWERPGSITELARVLRRQNKIYRSPTRIPFGDLGSPPEPQHHDHIAVARFSDAFYTLDGFTAALGNCSMHVLAAGYIEPVPNSTRCAAIVTEVGVYIRDTFDFVNRRGPMGISLDQPLGYWDDVVMIAGAARRNYPSSPSGAFVFNSTFQEWRRVHRRGGDYLVFSDIKRHVLREPSSYVFEY